MDNLVNDNPDRPIAIRRNFLWMTWSGVISIGSSLVVWVFMARLRDVEDVGRFTIVMGLYALFFNLTSLGLMPYLVNEITRRSALAVGAASSLKKFISSSAIFLTVSGLLCSIAMVSSGLIVSDSYQVTMSVMILSLTMVPSNLICILEAASIAHGRVKLLASVATMENLLRIMIPVGLIWTGFDIISICISFAAIRFVALLVYFAAVKVNIREFNFALSEFRKIAVISPTFAGTGVMASLNWQAPLFMLAYLSTESQSAEFGTASRFLIPVSILMAGYVNTIQPTLARKVLNDPVDGGRYLVKISSYPAAVAVAAAIGSLFLSGVVLTLLFGERYEIAAPTLKILALSVIPFCLVMVGSRGLIATGSQRIDLYANVIGFAACVGAGAIAIPIYGAVGAAIAQLVCFSSMAFVEVAFLLVKFDWFRSGSRAAWSSAGAVLFSLLLWNF